MIGDEVTLTEFLLARIAEDEAEARLIPDPFTEHGGDCSGSLCTECGHCMHSSEDCDCDCGGSGGGCRDAYVELPKMHKHVVAECGAKREILMHLEGARMGRDIFHPNQPPALLPVFIERAMAAVYADHPDYDEAWRA